MVEQEATAALGRSRFQEVCVGARETEHELTSSATGSGGRYAIVLAAKAEQSGPPEVIADEYRPPLGRSLEGA